MPPATHHTIRSMTRHSKKTPLIRRPWFAFFSSMRFAVSLLSVLAVASVIGTVLQQNRPAQDYVVKFGPFWAEIFGFLGLYDVYASPWFVLIMLFLVISTSLCLWRKTPSFLREMRSFRLKVTAKSLAHMKYSDALSGCLPPDVAERYFQVNGFKTQTSTHESGGILLAAKKGSLNKLGYICAHSAIIVICLGGLIDSNLLLKAGVLLGRIVPDKQHIYARDFRPESILGTGNPSFRANAEVTEGQTIDLAFINADRGLLLQKLPFDIELKQFRVRFYDNGMPREFASDIVVTEKDSGRKTERTIHVNHPLTVQGITIYQSSYGDGGSGIRFKSWDLHNKTNGKAADMKAVSQNSYPLDLGSAGKYTVEFGELRVFNVESNEAQKQGSSLIERLEDVRSVQHDKKFTNVGPTITYKLRDSAGQAREYVGYMLPLHREGAYFLASGERGKPDEPYRWLMIPIDSTGGADSFMALRSALNNPEQRARTVEKAVSGVSETMRPQFKLAVENLLRQFAEGGYTAINEHIKNTVPEAEQQKTGELMYQILYSAVNTLLDEALSEHNLPAMPAGEARGAFVLNSLDAYTSLTHFQAPVLLQLTGYKQVNMSGLQLARAPGAHLVYLGSLLLVLGTVFMFYVREKRAWVLFGADGSVRFAMSATRSERELVHDFPRHTADLERLAAELGSQTPDNRQPEKPIKTD